jgi:homoserine kinase
MRIRVRAPATTANLGAGFDCAAAALDLWNELEVTQSDGEADLRHLTVRAFARLAPPEGRSFAFVERIPRARGLGSSAAAIALGLVAGAVAAGRDATPDELLALGLELEGHPDNLAAALTGGVCLTWDGNVVRIADTAPATPIAVVPREQVETREARAALPEAVPHADAAFSVARAALLGAAVASGSAELFAAAADDRLHEPYRARRAPLLAAVRERLPAGALAATLSGSGPTVVVWTRPGDGAACVEELAERFPDADVLPLSISPSGAGPYDHSL